MQRGQAVGGVAMGWTPPGNVQNNHGETRAGRCAGATAFSSNVAMVLARQCRKSPREVAEEILRHLANGEDLIERVWSGR